MEALLPDEGGLAGIALHGYVAETLEGEMGLVDLLAAALQGIPYL
jgi:hypothetical protein